jgi:putative transposase
MGHERFERMCIQYGYQVQTPINYRRTTNSNGVVRFPNLIENLTINTINQVWVSDITYYEIGDRFYYLTFILDAYSRFIKGYRASKTLTTWDTTIPALKMALKHKPIPEDLIIHSDGGGQYYAKEFVGLTSEYKMRNSMAKEAFENPQAERINGTIKNNYLKHWTIKSYVQLVKSLDRSVRLYNYEKPHKSLKYSTPAQIEMMQYLYDRQTADGDESIAASQVAAEALSPLAVGQTASGSDVTLAKLKVNSR